MALTLSQDILDAIADSIHEPVLLAEIEIPYQAGTQTFRVTDTGGEFENGYPGITFGGLFFRQMIDGDIEISSSKDDIIDGIQFELDNTTQDRYWSEKFNACSINDWVKSVVRVYRTFRDCADRVQVYEGFLEVPEDIGDKFTIRSRQIIDVVGIQFPSLTYSQTCNWVAHFKGGTRCNYSGAATSCDGTWSTCKSLGMTHRFGGIKNALLRGSYTYKERRMFWFDKRKSGTFESEENSGIFGTVIPVIYGKCRLTADVVWQVDEGPINKFLAIIGVGPIEGVVVPPANVDRQYLPGESRVSNNYGSQPNIVLDNKYMNDYALYFGKDGVDGMRTPGSADHSLQEVDYLWNNPPGKAASYNEARDVGQTYSRLSYLIGAWKSSDQQQADRLSEVEVYVHGRILKTYAKVGGEWVCTETHTDNPAWVWLDILTNPDYGAGFPLSVIDLDHVAISAYVCDNEKFGFSHVFREKLDILDALSLVAHSCRGYTAYQNGKFFLVAQCSTAMVNKRAAEPSFFFSNASIVLGSDAYMAAGNEKESNSIEVPFIDYDQDWQTVPRVLDDSENINATGKKVTSGLKFVGVCGFGTVTATATTTAISTTDDPDLGYAVSATTALWDVDSTSGFAAGDYVQCGSEVCRIEEILTGQFKLSQSSGYVRAQYGGSSAETHSNGDTIIRVTMAHTGFDAANRLAYYHMNRSRLMRRKDGRKKVRGGIETMHLQVGDIVKLDLSELDLQDPDFNQTQYDGLYEIESIRWTGSEAEYILELANPDVFEATGIDSDVTITPVVSRLKWPFNVIATAEDITEGFLGDYGYILITWTVPDAPNSTTPFPQWVNIYWRRESEATYTRRRDIVRVKAATGFAKLFIPWDVWDETIVVYLAPESAYGVEIPSTPQKDFTQYADLSTAVNGDTDTWSVSDSALFSAGDWVYCGDELCKVKTVSTGSITLETENSKRKQYENTPRQVHGAGSAIYLAIVAVTNISKGIRSLSDTNWTSSFLSVFAEGPIFIARWSNPTVSWMVRDDPQETASVQTLVLPDWAIHHWEISYSPNLGLNPLITDPTDVNFDHDAVWVCDIPGGVHEKQGIDPGKTYYFAIRPVFFNNMAAPWQFQMDESGVNRKAITSSVWSAPPVDLPTYDQPPKVTGFSVNSDAMVVDTNGALKSRVAILFTKPDAEADPDGLWKSAKIYRGKLVQASVGNTVGDQGATTGGSTTKFDVVSELTESATILLEPWPTTSVFAAVSTGAKGNVAVEGRLDALWDDAVFYTDTRLWSEIAADEKVAQSFLLAESRKIARWDVWLKRTGTDFSWGPTLCLKMVNDCETGPDDASVIAVSTAIKVTSVTADESGAWVSFRFPDPPTLPQGVKYWLVLEPTGTYASEFVTGVASISVAYTDDGAQYLGGELARKHGGSWTIQTGMDTIFRNFTYYYPRVVLDLTPPSAGWNVQNFSVTSLTAGRNDGIPCDAFTMTWEVPSTVDPGIIESFDIAYSAMQGFNADVPAAGTAAEVTYAIGIERTQRRYYKSDQGRTCYFAIRAKQKDGKYTSWVYFGEENGDASTRHAVTTHYPIGRIIVADYRIYSYGFASGKLFPNEAFPGTTPQGFEINSDGTAEFNDVFIRAAAKPTDTNGLVYAGSIIGDYCNDWYGVFMNATGIVGRQKLSGSSTKNPAVFLLAAQDYIKDRAGSGGDWPEASVTDTGYTSDPVHPSVSAGDFCVSTDVQRAYEVGDVPYLLFQPGYQNEVDNTVGLLKIRSQVHIIGHSTIEGSLGLSGTYSWIWVGTDMETAPVTIQPLGFACWDVTGSEPGNTAGRNTGNLAFAAWAQNYDGELPGPVVNGVQTAVPVSAKAGDVWLRRAYIGPYVDDNGDAKSMEITPNSITSADFQSGSEGKGFKLYTNGSAEFHSVTVRVGDIPSGSNLVYAGSMVGDYEDDWYGIFMSSVALAGRQRSDDPRNPVVFLLAAQDFDNSGANPDPVLPSFLAGDFCISTDVKKAYEEDDTVPYLRFQPSAGKFNPGSLRIRSQIHIVGDSTVDGNLTLTGGTGSSIVISSAGILGNISTGNAGFVLASEEQQVWSNGYSFDIAEGQIGAWSGIIGGWELNDGAMTSGKVGLYSGGNSIRIFAGETFANRESAPLQIHNDGYLYIGKTGTGGYRTYICSASVNDSSGSTTELSMYGGPWNGTMSTTLGRFLASGTSGGIHKGTIYLKTSRGSGSELGLYWTDGYAMFVIQSGYKFVVKEDGDLYMVNGLKYAWPTTQGSAGQSLKISSVSDGVATLAWSS